METADLLKEPILTSTNGAHDSSKEVDGPELTENVSDLKEPSILSLKDSSPILNKELSTLSDRKELSPEPPSKEESPTHSSKEASPLRLSKEPSPLPTRKESEEASSHEESVQQSKESSPLLIHKEEDSLQKNIEAPPLIQPESVISSTQAFVLSESMDISSQPALRTESSLPPPEESSDKKDADLAPHSSTESNVFPTITSEPLLEPAVKVTPLIEAPSSDSIKKEEEEDSFGFNKPLPPEPIESTADFLKSETTISNIEDNEMKPMPPKVVADDDFVTDKTNAREEDITRKSPSPPPIPKHQNLREDPSERYEPSQTPEPDFAAFKPVSSIDDKFGEPVDAPEPVPVSKPEEVTIPKSEITSTKPEVSPKTEEQPQPPAQTKLTCSLPKKAVDVIGAKDIRGKIVESLIYWRDPKKSGIVFGVTMVSLLSLTYYSLISVVAYLCLLTLGGTITFRVYKNIMQAVQKTSDGHPFKDLLEVDLAVSQDKVNEVSHCLVQYLNTSLNTLRSLFLVEDLIDSIKFVVLLWVLTYVGACFNGLTLIIIGVILLFSLPKVYENNKAQIDVYMKMGMDKLSIITNRMKAAVPEGKKDEKPKDQ